MACVKLGYTARVLGVFDSGFGGLTVLRAIREAMPELSVIYLGDNARAPYGNRDRVTVTRYAKECCLELFNRGCSLIVLACNTASADTLHDLQHGWLKHLEEKRTGRRNVIGIIWPLAEEASAMTRTGRVGVVGTRATIESGAYVREIKKLKPDVEVLQQACPLLVPLVEEGWIDKTETRRLLRRYLMPLKLKNPDVLILGCTHYEVLYHLFRKKIGKRCTVLHSPAIIAGKLSDYLKRHPEYEMENSGVTMFLTTGDRARFAEIGRGFYGERLENVKKITL